MIFALPGQNVMCCITLIHQLLIRLAVIPGLTRDLGLNVLASGEL